MQRVLCVGACAFAVFPNLGFELWKGAAGGGGGT